MIHPQPEHILPRRLHWGGPATSFFGILIAVVFLIIHTVVIGIFTAIETASNQGADIHAIVEGLTNSGFVLSIGSIAATCICVPIIFLIIWIKKGSSIREYLGLKFVQSKALYPWFLLIIIFLICYDTITYATGRPIVPEFMTAAYKTAKFPPLLWMTFIVLAPVLEELFFRGFLFRGYQSTFLRPAGTVVLTSVLWAVIHTQYDYYDIAFIFIIGILLGTARIKTQSVLTTVYLHSFMNLIATIETAIVVS